MGTFYSAARDPHLLRPPRQRQSDVVGVEEPRRQVTRLIGQGLPQRRLPLLRRERSARPRPRWRLSKRGPARLHLPESRHPMGGSSTHSPPSEGTCQEEEACAGAGDRESELSFGAERGGEGDGGAGEEVEEQGGEGGGGGGAGGGRRRAREGCCGEVRRVRERGGGGGADGERVRRHLVNVPHMKHGKKEKKKKKMLRTCVRLGITEVLEDLEAEEDDEVVVTIVPRVGKGLVSIESVKIELSEYYTEISYPFLVLYNDIRMYMKL